MYELYREFTIEPMPTDWKAKSNGKSRPAAPLRVPFFLRLLALFGL